MQDPKNKKWDYWATLRWYRQGLAALWHLLVLLSGFLDLADVWCGKICICGGEARLIAISLLGRK